MNYDYGLRLYQFLLSKGISPPVAAGFTGSFGQESSYNPVAFNPNDAGPGKHSYGFGQWNRDRFSALQNTAQSMGTDWRDPMAQFRHIGNELSGKYSGILARLQKGTSVEDGVRAGIAYEGPASDPASQAVGNRTRNAYDILQRGQGLAPQGYTGPPPAVSQYDPLSSIRPPMPAGIDTPQAQKAWYAGTNQPAFRSFVDWARSGAGLPATGAPPFERTPATPGVTASVKTPLQKGAGLLGALGSMLSDQGQQAPQAPAFQGTQMRGGDPTIPLTEYPMVSLPQWGEQQMAQASPEDQRMRQLLAMLGRG